MNLIIFGFGYTAKACVNLLAQQATDLTVTVRSKEKRDAVRKSTINAYCFDGINFEPELNQKIHNATHIIISVPPDDSGDPVLNCFLQKIENAPDLKSIIYFSTIGVYGNFDGAWINETTAPNAISTRAARRLKAESEWLDFGKRRTINTHVLRLAGIYGKGRNALCDFANGTARRIFKENQVFNRIHVEDIARITAKLLESNLAYGVWNICDYEPCPPQDVVLYAAELLGIEPPPLQPYETAQLTDMGRAFYSENKRVSNEAICQKLDFEFSYPTYREGLKMLHEQGEGQKGSITLRTKRR